MPVKKASQATPNLLLRQARLARGWTQIEVATLIDAPHAFLINRWENGTSSPSAVYRQRLVKLFELDLQELGLVTPGPSSPGAGEAQMIADPALPLPPANGQELIGREELLAEIRLRLSESRGQARLALSGLPGVGKTTLSVALAHDPALQQRFRDGILWIGLGPQPNLLALLSRWGGLLGINQSEAESLKNQESWLAWLRRAIGTRQMLLIIDDAWTIEDALTCLVGGPQCSYLLTTRLSDVALQFAGTHVLRVPELSQDDSRHLLLQLAPALAEASHEAIQQLILATGGLPLALTLLGQHLLVQAGQQTGRRLQSTLARLQSFEERIRLQQPQAGLQRDYRLPDGTALSLEAVIGLSETDLSMPARQMLAALAVFPAKPTSFTEEAALAVAQKDVENLDSLVDAGLVEYIGQGRYTIHQTIADYARARYYNTNTNEQRMATYYRDFLASQQQNYPVLEPETANIIQALHFAMQHDMQELFIQSVLNFVPFLQNRAMQEQIERYLEQAESFARASQHQTLLLALLQVVGRVTTWSGQYERAEAAYQEYLRLAEQGNDPRTTAQSFLSLGVLAFQRGEYGQAERYFQEGLPLARQANDQRCLYRLLNGLGGIASERGDYAQAEMLLQEALAAARLSGPEDAICKILNNLGSIAAKQSDPARAECYWQEVLATARAAELNEVLCAALSNLGELMAHLKRFDEAERYHEECLILVRKLGHPERLSRYLAASASLLRKQKDYDKAQVYVQEGLELAEQMGNRRLLSELWLEMGEIALQSGQIPLAEQALRKAEEWMPEGQQVLQIDALYVQARLAALRGYLVEAHRLGEECLASFASGGYYRLAEVQSWLDSLPSVSPPL